jgi:hypothetical protein
VNIPFGLEEWRSAAGGKAEGFISMFQVIWDITFVSMFLVVLGIMCSIKSRSQVL